MRRAGDRRRTVRACGNVGRASARTGCCASCGSAGRISCRSTVRTARSITASRSAAGRSAAGRRAARRGWSRRVVSCLSAAAVSTTLNEQRHCQNKCCIASRPCLHPPQTHMRSSHSLSRHTFRENACASSFATCEPLEPQRAIVLTMRNAGKTSPMRDEDSIALSLLADGALRADRTR